MRVPFRVLIIKVPYYIGDLKRDPSFRELPRLTTTRTGLALRVAKTGTPSAKPKPKPEKP